MADTKPPRLTPDEKRLARCMHFEQKKQPAEIARTLDRSLSAICRLLGQKRAPRPVGRPPALTGAKVDRIVALLERMVTAADGSEEVTMDMLMRRGRLKVSKRVVANALHSRGYRFRDLRQKPILTPDDVAERYAWAKKYARKSREWWLQAVHVHLDNHVFKVATTGKGRKLLAKRRVRGVYRTKGKSLKSAHVKPGAKQHLSLGAKGILKAGALAGGSSSSGRQSQGPGAGARQRPCLATSCCQRCVHGIHGHGASAFSRTMTRRGTSPRRASRPSAMHTSRSCTSPSGRRTSTSWTMRSGQRWSAA